MRVVTGLPENWHTDLGQNMIHIHEGTSCETDTLGHYFNADRLLADPWVHISAIQEIHRSHVVMTGTIVVDNGYTLEQNVGHAVVCCTAAAALHGCRCLLLV